MALRRWLGLGKEPKPEGLLDALLDEASRGGPAIWKWSALDFVEIQRIAALPLAEQIPYVLASVRHDQKEYAEKFALHQLRKALLPKGLPFRPESMTALAESIHGAARSPLYADPVVSALETYAAVQPLPERALEVLRTKAAENANGADGERIQHRIVSLLGQAEGDAIDAGPIMAGEAWGDRARQELTEMQETQRARWMALLRHALTATQSKPSAKWEKAVGPLVEGVGREELIAALRRWLPSVKAPRTIPDNRPPPWNLLHDQLIIAPHQDVLKGLAWIVGVAQLEELAGPLTDLAISTYRKVPGHGARAPSVGNACVFALGRMPDVVAVTALARLKVRVRHRALQNNISKVLQAAAVRAGVTTDELEEMSVPTLGLTDVGFLTEPLGEHTATLRVIGTSTTELRFVSTSGKSIKSVPAKVKSEHTESLKDLKASAKEIEALLPAQRERLDQLHLSQRSWDVAVWKERYLDHALIGTLARRLIWTFARDDGSESTAIFCDGELRDAIGQPIEIAKTARVSLWHPISHPVEHILAWREFVETREVKQPFKQAHREVYVLTDAERVTRFYSNRFAAHILKQHQFNALCGVRGWSNSLRLAVDAEYPPASLALPRWGLRAEFWIEGMGGDGTDINDAGVFHYVTTDQVRFYPIDSEALRAHATGGGYASRRSRDQEEPDPIPLSEIPPLVFSEVMRDVDLFVGVSSVANDPTWHDGGPDGHRAYWEAQSFGSLEGTAKSRREVLLRLIPRLKIAPRCSFTDRFLIVKGDLRTYKIHLGSGNILMEPDDRYLCIVPKASSLSSATGKVFLPFEGDRTLSIVLSKAFLLAADRDISDPSIVSQIAG